MAGMSPSSQSSSDSSGDSQPISAINVTPFVDVVLVLLVIFIITAPTLMKEAIAIKLPKSATSEAQPTSPLGVAINKDGLILVNGVLMTDEQIVNDIKSLSEKSPDLQALIAADAEAKHKDVVRAIDLIKKAGVHRFALQVDKTP